jgi:hypothetical protein
VFTKFHAILPELAPTNGYIAVKELVGIEYAAKPNSKAFSEFNVVASEIPDAAANAVVNG